MRIVSGKFKGKRLVGPNSGAIRPTSDRSRESVFNILAHGQGFDWADRRVIDLFAGTGALGFEALSRGASFALFVEEAAQARAILRQNMQNLELNGVAKIFRRDATKLGFAGTMEPFDLAFLDPPYNRDLGTKALSALHDGGWLKPGASVILEEAREAEVTIPSPFLSTQSRDYAMTRIHFLTYIKDE